jgi:hypothetical protein
MMDAEQERGEEEGRGRQAGRQERDRRTKV